MSDDSAFFEELQSEFLAESRFLLEQYEESMLDLENGEHREDALTKIFRVAHSIKGGAAAVGFTDLSQFSHIVEDLLDLLRNNPELTTSEIVSLLLRSGDEIKKRIDMLGDKNPTPWNTDELKHLLEAQIAKIEGTPAPSLESPAPPPATADSVVDSPNTDFLVNHELLAELLGQSDSTSPEAETTAAKEDYIPDAPEAPIKPIASTQTVPTTQAVTSKSLPPSNKTIPTAPTAAKQTAQSSKNTSGSIKVDNYRIDSVLDAVGELVVLKNQLVHDDTIRASGNQRLESIVGQLDKSIKELYEKTLSIRMTPLKSLFIKLQRIVRDVSLQLEKPVHLELIGEDTEVDRTVAELLNDPMVHIVRNALDHGIEKPEQRSAKGKPAEAILKIIAKQAGGNVLIEVSDDGAGIHREKVLQKAIEKGLVDRQKNLDSIPDEEVFQLIFAAGFSTAEKVSDLSGRGVGLDVVKSNLEKVHGKISIASTHGKGSTFKLSIPLTTSITDGIDVLIQGHRFILPIHSIREIVRVAPEDFTTLPDKGSVLKIREHLVQVLETDRILGQFNLKKEVHSSGTDEGSALNNLFVILESLHQQFALNIDEVIGQAQVVVKSMNMGFGIEEIAGAAILGNGQTVLILDPSNMINNEHVLGTAA